MTHPITDPTPSALKATGIAGLETRFIEGTPRIAFDAAGAVPAPPLFFLHGIGGNRHNWIGQMTALSDDYACHAWDARGYGLSDDYDGPLHLADFSADLLRVLDTLEVAKAHLCGLSMGGRILQEFAIRHPERVATLILLATDTGEQFTQEQREAFVRLRQAPLLAGKTPAEIAPAVADSLKGDLCTDAAYARMTQSVSDLHAESYIKTVTGFGQWQRPRPLTGIEAPVLLLYGTEDRLTTPEMGRQIASEIEGARFELIEGAGHLLSIEASDQTTDIIRDFLVPHRNRAGWA